MNPIITDVYKLLFGRKGMAEGSVIDMAEHGRAGGISSGQGFKFTDNPSYILELDFDGGTNPVYIGSANPGTATSASSWQIKKLTYDGNNPTSIMLADGNSNFDNIWDNRASLSYS